MEHISKMEGPGIPNASKNRPQKLNKGLRKGIPPREGLGRVLDGFGEYFGRVLEGFGSPGRVQMHMKINTFRRKFRSFPQDPPRDALGRVLEGFGEIWEGFGRIFGKLVRFSWGILGNPREGG